MSEILILRSNNIKNNFYFREGLTFQPQTAEGCRAWGLIPRSNIVGRAEFVWFPLSRFGKMRFIDNGEKAGSDAIVPEFLR